MLKNRINVLSNKIRRPKISSLKLKHSMAISFVVHIVIALTVASIFFNQKLMAPRSIERIIEFDLINEKIELPEKNYAIQNPERGHEGQNLSQNSNKLMRTENRFHSQKAFVMASLSTLSELNESFRFQAQQIRSDTTDVFNPIQSDAPDIKFLAEGLRNGIIGSRGNGIRISSGSGGNCPPRGGGGILK